MTTVTRLLSKYTLSGIEFPAGSLVSISNDTFAASLATQKIADSTAAAITRAGVEGFVTRYPDIEAQDKLKAFQPGTALQDERYYQTLSQLPIAASFGVGSAWVGGVQYYSDGVSWSKLNSADTAYPTWRFATFGDSRANSSSSGTDVNLSTVISSVRAAFWATSFLGDAELTRNYGVDADTAVGWNVAARTGGKTFIDLNASNIEAVLIQYGINDAIALTSAATITAALKALVIEILKGGKYCFFEAINPIRAPATNLAAAQVIVDSVNSSMQSWLLSYSPISYYIDTSTSLKGSDGYAQAIYYNADGVHFNTTGALFSGKLIANEVRKYLTKRGGVRPSLPVKNILNQITPNAFFGIEKGTSTVGTFTTGQDSDGTYIETSWTPLTLTAGETRIRIDIAANFQTATPPYYALLGNEILQGSSRTVLTNGSGGAPNAYSLASRIRFYTATLQRDMGAIAATPTDIDFQVPVDMTMFTPKIINTTASIVANPSGGGGLNYQVFISSQAINIPLTLRIYNPQLLITGYSNPISVTPGASPYTYTNSTTGNQTVYVAGGTVSGITHNGIATGQIAGIFTIAPTDTLVTTYTVAPTTFTVKQF